MEIKICSKCKKELPVVNFTIKNRIKNKFESWCKQCKAEAQRERLRKYSDERKEEIRLYKREWFKNNKDKINEHEKKQRELWHRKAHIIVGNYRKKYKELFCRCSICWNVWRVLAHHPNYNEPTKVIIVCDSCHQSIHRWRLKADATKIIDLNGVGLPSES